jgi:cytochrome c peroxidase
MLLMICGVAAAGTLPAPVSDADFQPRDEAKERLGQMLFFDKILSGNRNDSCASCHHPMAATGDGLSLPVGEGGVGLGVTRDTGHDTDAVHERVPRNAPHVFNLGAYEYTRMFFDGRVEMMPSHPSGFRSPAGDNLPSGLDSALAAQAMFPVTSAAEMAGQVGENEVAKFAAEGDLPAVWAALDRRLRTVPEYVDMFEAAFEDVNGPDDITFVHAANAIAAFEAAAWRADNSPFDRWLRGDEGAMSPNQLRGMDLFYGDAGCADCHSGPFQTDHDFHAIGMPQVGPGKGDDLVGGRRGGHHDFGRERVTHDPADRMRFRTPSLRNIALTAPYGHDGAYNDLESVVRHHLQPRQSLIDYDSSQLVMPGRDDLDQADMIVMHDAIAVAAIASRIEIPERSMADEDVARLLDFLHALTDRESLDLRRNTPARVPSGLPVFD